MNDIIQILLQTLLKVGGAALVTRGVISAPDWATAATQLQTIGGAVMALIGLAWHFSHFADSRVTSLASAKLARVALILCALAPLLAGCTTAIKQGDIVEIDQTVFGMNVAAATSANETPALQFGLIRSKLLLLPTATNGTVSAPTFATSGSLNNSGRTAVFGGDDSSVSGAGASATSVSNTVLLPIVPTTNAP